MRTAVIGSTGFVGGNLVSQIGNKVDGYNSKNISTVDGKSYDLVLCAGARAEKWKINQDPDTDTRNLDELKRHLSSLTTNKLVLISTVDVYPNPIDVDEDSAIDEGILQPYGLHRLELERFCAERFDTTIVRLPGLFGTGIKKNVIYDFLHDNNLDQINADSSFQFYFLDNIWRDVQTALAAELKVVNFATEPTTVREVASEGFGLQFDNRPPGKPAASYDFKTKYAESFGGSHGYMVMKEQVLAAIKAFADRESAAA